MELLTVPFVERFKKNCFGKVFLIYLINTWNNLLKHCISAKFLLMEGYVHGALTKELRIAPFVEHFKTTTLGNFP